jgi:hypothetical protein
LKTITLLLFLNKCTEHVDKRQDDLLPVYQSQQ